MPERRELFGSTATGGGFE